MFYVGLFFYSLLSFLAFISSTLQHPPFRTSPFPILDRRDSGTPVSFKISCFLAHYPACGFLSIGINQNPSLLYTRINRLQIKIFFHY